MAVADYLALAELKAGTAGKRALVDVRTGLCIAIELARANIGPEALLLLLKADLVLRNAAARGLPLGLHGDDLLLLRDACEAAQAQRQLCTLPEYEQASARDDELRRLLRQ